MNDTFDNFAFTQTEKSFLNNLPSSHKSSVKEEVLLDDTCCFSESLLEKEENVFTEDIFSNVYSIVQNNKGKNFKEKKEDEYKISESIVDCINGNVFFETFRNKSCEDDENIDASDSEAASNKANNNVSSQDIFIDDSDNEEILDISDEILHCSNSKIKELASDTLETDDFFSNINTQVIKSIENVEKKVEDRLTLIPEPLLIKESNSIKNICVNKSLQTSKSEGDLKPLSNSVKLDDQLKRKHVENVLCNKKLKPTSIASEIKMPNIVQKKIKLQSNITEPGPSNQESNFETVNLNSNQNQIIDKNKSKLINLQTNDDQMKIENTQSSTYLNLNKQDLNQIPSSSVCHSLKKIIITEENSKLSAWGLPEAVLQKYEHRKVIKMFPWQVECLSNENVMKNNANLVYSAPTSAGKTLVAEIIAIKTVFERQKKVIFILPFVSIVREKMYYFQDILGSSGIRVEGFMGSYNPPGGFQTVQVAICTMEKANSLVNRLLEEGKLSDIGAILVDEMHLLGDPSRGYLLELLLTKLKYITSQDKDVNIQIVGMSATLPNLDYLAKWLDAELYTTSFRPIPLIELAHVSGEIYDNNLHLVRKLSAMPDIGTDTDNILQLCLETIQESCSVLIFCPTKNWCENLSQQIAAAFFKIGSSKTGLGEMLRSQLKTNLIMELLEQLKISPAGLDEILRKTVSFGVAFHHAGLTMDERDIIEGAFRNGALRVLVATSTLSSGVNLPARRVIIRTPNFHGKPIDTLTYRQMIGRAGRMGKDDRGESILICQKSDHRIAKDLMSAELQAVESCLEGAGKLKRAILEVIASGVATSPEDVALFTNCTLLAVETRDTEQNLENPIDEAVNFLRDNEFIRLQTGDDGSARYVPTSLGKACLSSSMAPDEGLALFTELEKARQCFVLETELHLIYLVTPYSACHTWGNIDWMFYLELWEKLPANMKRVGELVGVRDSYLINATRSKLQTNTNKLYHQWMVHKRFFVALALQDLVNEKSLGEVCAKFNCNRGMLQSLQQSASSFAGMVTAFSRQLGWSSVEILISQFQDRMQFGVSRDLLDLMRLAVLNNKMARILYNSGVETLVQLANSEVCNIENVLYKVVPFESEKGREGESEFDKNKRTKLRNIWVTGKEGLTMREAAEMLIKDARNYLKIELGLAEAKWETKTEDRESCPVADTLPQNVLTEKKQSQIECIPSNLNTSDKQNNNDLSKDDTNSNNTIDVSENKKENDHVTSPKPTNIIKNETSTSESDEDMSIKSDTSAFNDSFTLQLSEDHSKDSLNSAIKLSEDGDDLNESDDILVSSFNEDLGDKKRSMSRKRGRINSIEQLDGMFLDDITAKKKKKMDTVIVDEKYSQPTHEVYLQSKLENESELDFSKLHIVDVCSSENLFKSFSEDIKKISGFALALGCTKIIENKPVVGLNTDPTTSTTNSSQFFSYKTTKVDGVAISIGQQVVYYISLTNDLKAKVINLFRDVLANTNIVIKIFDCKEQIRMLKKCCDLDLACAVEDIKVADWIMDPEGKEKNLTAMALHYGPELLPLLQLSGSFRGVGSISLDTTSSIEPRLRSSIECLVTWYVTDSAKAILYDTNPAFMDVYDIEMKTCLSLSKNEINGMGISRPKMQKLADDLKKNMEDIESRCYSLAGRRFNMSSPPEVARILGLSSGKKVSTKKEVLEKCTHPIANLILQWRKLSSTLTKMIYPLIRNMENDRLSGTYLIHTATGRISMQEPNLQTVAKDFTVIDPVTKESRLLSCRNAFTAPENCTLVSADYCQLELRLLAHLSQDKILCNIMRAPGDVFRSIAAKWNKVEENMVDNNMRQNTKHICYGIIYGMGSKTLADQLGLTEEEALQFMNTFRNAYPSIQVYIQKTIENCKACGYVETISGRRRYLNQINSTDMTLRSQAERQAINTTVQGSAADMAKKAMTNIDEKLINTFCKSKQKPKLILHLHDELIYEVPTKYVRKVAKIMKNCMENAVHLSIPFPVKLRTGPSWGELTDYIL